jgi:methionyl aminopeptidase
MDREEILAKIHELKSKGVEVPTDQMIKSDEQIEGIRKASLVNTKVLDEVSKQIRPYMTTEEIDEIVRLKSIEFGGKSAVLGYEGYPKNCCTSVNDQVCHGIPSKKDVLMPGDIVNVDCTTYVDGYYGDSSRMFIIGETTKDRADLCERVKKMLDKAFESLVPWESTLGDIGYIINKMATSYGYQVVREVGGHGVGLEIHEDPYVCHVGKKKTGMLITPGMVFTIEPMVNRGKRHVFLDASNDWTIYTEDGSDSAQWEYTIAVFEDHCEVLAH